MVDFDELPTENPTRQGHAGLPERVLGLTLLWHPDLSRVGERAVLFDPGSAGARALCRGEPEFRSPAGGPARPLETPSVSRRPSTVTADAQGNVTLQLGPSAVLAGDQGAGKPCSFGARELERGVVLELGDSVALLLHRLDPAPDGADDLGMCGSSPAMRRLREDIRSVADLDVPVLLRGESGVGKELVAAAIHALSPRARGPRVNVNMAAIPESLASSLLFGHERGAFTHAAGRHRGYFQQAHLGTLFLDEVGDTPAEVQPMLLRAIEDDQVQPLGGAPVPVDVRLVAATDADLELAMARDAFRRPLFERLSSYDIRVPPLRERREDIGRLFARFVLAELERIDRTALAAPDEKGKAWIPGPVVARFAAYDWPGNVRQLRNFARRCVIGNRHRQRFVLPDVLDIALAAQRDQALDADEQRPSDRPRSRLAELTNEHIIDAVRRNDNELNRAILELGVSRDWFFRRIASIPEIRQGKDLGAEEIRRACESHPGDFLAAARELGVSARALKQQVARLQLVLQA